MASFYPAIFFSCILTSIKGTFDFDFNGDLEYSGVLPSNQVGDDRLSSNMARASLDFSSIMPPETFQVWPYVSKTKDLTFNDCFPKVRPQQEAAFAMIQAESGTKYRAHIVKSDEQMCFRDYYTYKENMTLKLCLELADQWDAPSFHFNKTSKYCQLYKDWRYNMYSNCRRGSSEEIFYLLNKQPRNHKPCRGVQMHFNASYTATGSVQLTGTTKRDYCGCDIDRITLTYLDTTVEMNIVPEIPSYTYTYPLASIQAWFNFTTIIVYSRNAIVAQTEYVPSDDMF